MPKPLVWTDPHDTVLRRMRASGDSWDAIAACLGISRWAAVERGRSIGATRKPPRVLPDPDLAELRNPGREPLPAGHRETWGRIALAGAAYPWPPLPPEHGA